MLASSGSFAPSPLSIARSMIVKPGGASPVFDWSIRSRVQTLLPIAVRQTTSPLSSTRSETQEATGEDPDEPVTLAGTPVPVALKLWPLTCTWHGNVPKGVGQNPL